MTRIIDFAAPLGQKAGPGKWNDLDMLEVGNGGMSYDEYGAFISSVLLHLCPFVDGCATALDIFMAHSNSHALLDVVDPQEPADSWKRRYGYGTFYILAFPFPFHFSSLFYLSFNFLPGYVLILCGGGALNILI